jgi:hypothetical protein
MRLLSAVLIALTAANASAVCAQGSPRPRDPSSRPAYQQGHSPNYPFDRQGGIQLDASALLAEPGPLPLAEREPAPVNRPMFSDGWTRDGFGGRPGGWR